jgi:hypothetical protein
LGADVLPEASVHARGFVVVKKRAKRIDGADHLDLQVLLDGQLAAN